MNQNVNRIVLFAHMALAALVAGLILYGAMYLSSMFSLEAKVSNIQLIVSLLAVVLGVSILLIFQKNEKIRKYSFEVADEFSRVTWPTTKEVKAATLVVAVFVIIAGFTLGIFDFFINKIIVAIIGV